MIFLVGLAMFEQFSLLPWSPQGLPGTAEQISVAYIAKNLYLCSTYIYVYRIMTFMKFGSLLNACCQIGSKSIGNIFNIYEYIWLVHKINDKSCGWQTALELLPVHTGPILNSIAHIH